MNTMTDSEWLKLANKLMSYSGRTNASARQNFINICKRKKIILKKARALWGDRNIYYADMQDINYFVNDAILGGIKDVKGKYTWQQRQAKDANEYKHLASRDFANMNAEGGDEF